MAKIGLKSETLVTILLFSIHKNILTLNKIVCMKKLLPEIKITGIYVIIGFIWILFSDEAMLLISKNPNTIEMLSLFKGWFYVLATGVLLYFLVRSYRFQTEKKNNELIKSKEKAEESDKMKTNFLANLSHELRSPMNAILGFTELIDNPENTIEKRHRYVPS